jgi:uncharacterized protein (TIGR02246 family)
MSNNRAADEAAIQAVLDASYKGWEAGDADGMVADYSTDATVVMNGVFRADRADIRDNMALSFAGPLKGSTTWNNTLRFRFLGDDAAVVLTEAAILFAGQTEVAEERKINATWVFERVDGGWKIVAYSNALQKTAAH